MKKISQIETGGRFLYGGVEWVKLYAGDGTVAISAEPVFERASTKQQERLAFFFPAPRTERRVPRRAGCRGRGPGGVPRLGKRPDRR